MFNPKAFIYVNHFKSFEVRQTETFKVDTGRSGPIPTWSFQLGWRVSKFHDLWFKPSRWILTDWNTNH